MAQAVPRHYAILSEAIARRGGVRPVEQGEGDSLVGAFARGEVAAGRGRHVEAAGLLGAADSVRAELEMVRFLPEHGHWATVQAGLRAELGDRGYDVAHGAGRARGREEATAWALRAGERPIDRAVPQR